MISPYTTPPLSSQLSGGELEAAALACGEALLAEADSNGDGVINFNEYMAWWAKRRLKQRINLEAECLDSGVDLKAGSGTGG